MGPAGNLEMRGNGARERVETGQYFNGLQGQIGCSICACVIRFNYMFCRACLGSPFAAATGFHCFCPVTCPQCKEHTVQDLEFQACKAQLESGVSVTVGVTQQTTGFFTSSRERQKVAAWFSLNARLSEFCWTSLEQKNGRPLQEVHIPVGKIVTVRNTGVALELSIMGENNTTDTHNQSRHLIWIIDHVVIIGYGY